MANECLCWCTQAGPCSQLTTLISGTRAAWYPRARVLTGSSTSPVAAASSFVPGQSKRQWLDLNQKDFK